MEKYNPWKESNIELGNAQAGTFVFSEVDADGISSKVIVDDVSVNSPLAPPKGTTDAVLAGGVNIKVTLDKDYTPTIIEKDGRLRTCRLVIKTHVSPLNPGTYGINGAKPTTSPTDNSRDKQTITNKDIGRVEDIVSPKL